MDIIAESLSAKTLKSKNVLINGEDIVKYFESKLSAGVTFVGVYDHLSNALSVNGGIVIINTKEYIYSSIEGHKGWHEIGDEGLIGSIVSQIGVINNNIEYLGSVSSISEYQLTANPGSMAYEDKDDYLTAVPDAYKTYVETKNSLSADGYALTSDIPTYAVISSNINLSDYIKEVPTTYKTYDNTKNSLSADGYALKTDISSAADISAELSLSDYIKEVPVAYKTYDNTKNSLSADGYALKTDISSAADISAELSLSDYIKEVPTAYKTYDNTKTALTADGFALTSDIPTYAVISSNINLSSYTQLTTTTELQQNCEKTEKVVNDQVLSYKIWDMQYTPSSSERTGGNNQMTNIPDYYTIFFTPTVYRDSVNAIKKFTLMMTSSSDQIPSGDVYIKLVDSTTHKVLAVSNAVQCSQNATVEFTFNKLVYLDPHKEYWLKICTTPDENTYEDHVSAFGVFVQTKTDNPAWTPELHYMNTINGYLSAFRPVMTVTWTDNKINDYVLKDSLYNTYQLSATEGIAQTDKGIVSMVSVCLSVFDNDYESITQFGFQRRDTSHGSDAYSSNQTLYTFGSTATILTSLNESNIYLSSLYSFKYPGYNGIVTVDLTSTGKTLPDNTEYLYFYFLSTDVINSQSLASYSKYSIGVRQYRFNAGKDPNYVLPTTIGGNKWYPAISIKYKKSKLAEKQWVEDKLGDITANIDTLSSLVTAANNSLETILNESL